MHVPFGIGRFVFAGGFTAASAGFALARQLAGQQDAVRHITVPWARAVAHGIGMDVRVHGAGRVDVDSPCVFVSNHQSHFDIVALYVALPIQPGFLAKQELREVPIFGKAMAVSGHVFVDRKRRSSAFAAIDEAAMQVRDGRPIVIFPEGTRSDPGTVKRFKKGGFHLAKKAGVPIVPVGLRGTAAMLSKHERRVRPGRVDVHIGEPIPAEATSVAPIEEMVERVRREIATLSAMRLVDRDRD